MSDRENEKDKGKGFTVSDKRSFVIGENGQVEEQAEKEAPSAAPSDAPEVESKAAEAAQEPEQKGDRQEKKSLRDRIKEKLNKAEDVEEESDHPMPEINFTNFILSLSTSAMMHFGEIQDPISGKQERNIALAKQTIDLLGLLEEKTRGNLTDDEKRFLESILFDLRMRFVEYNKQESSPKTD